jgi:hypothetical protein
MARDPNVKVKITAENDTKKGLKQAEAEVKNFASNVATMAKGATALVAASAVGSFFKSSVAEALQAEKSFAFVGQALTNIGVNATKVRPEIDGVVNALSTKMGIDNDEVNLAFASMTTKVGNYKTALQALPTVLDVAKARNMDLGQASDLVSKALNGNEGALKKLGVSVKEGETAFDALRRTYKGFAQAEANTFQGTIDRLVVGWKNIEEAVGKAIIGTDNMQSSGNLLVDVMKNLETFISNNAGTIQSLIGVLIDFGSTIGTMLSSSGVLTLFGKAIQGIAALLVISSAGWEKMVPVVRIALGSLLGILANWSESVDKILGRFGINVGEGVIKKIRKVSDDLMSGQMEALEAIDKKSEGRLLSIFESVRNQPFTKESFTPVPKDKSLGEKKEGKSKQREKEDEERRLSYELAVAEAGNAYDRIKQLDNEYLAYLQLHYGDITKEVVGQKLTIIKHAEEAKDAKEKIEKKASDAAVKLLDDQTDVELYNLQKGYEDQAKLLEKNYNELKKLDERRLEDVKLIYGEQSKEYINMISTMADHDQKYKAEQEKEAQKLKQKSEDMAQKIGDGIENIMVASFSRDGNTASAAKQFESMILGTLGTVLMKQGEAYIAQSAIMISLSKFLSNPFTAGPAALGIGIALTALGAMLRGQAAKTLSTSSRSGVGGSVSSQGLSNTQESLQNSKGDATIVINGGLLDMTDPKQARALRDAINGLNGRRVTITPVGA